jgi:hypothetical protein
MPPYATASNCCRHRSPWRRRTRKALFLEFQNAGVTFFQSLKREPWGARDFIVRDPDGNLLLFAGPAE